MVRVPTWEVNILIDGPVTLRRPFRTMQQKGFRPENPFYSDIQIASIPSGLRATVTARALNKEDTALPGDSVANVSQIITLDKTFLTERVSWVSDRIMMSVEDGLRTVLAL